MFPASPSGIPLPVPCSRRPWKHTALLRIRHTHSYHTENLNAHAGMASNGIPGFQKHDHITLQWALPSSPGSFRIARCVNNQDASNCATTTYTATTTTTTTFANATLPSSVVLTPWFAECEAWACKRLGRANVTCVGRRTTRTVGVAVVSHVNRICKACRCVIETVSLVHGQLMRRTVPCLPQRPRDVILAIVRGKLPATVYRLTPGNQGARSCPSNRRTSAHARLGHRLSLPTPTYETPQSCTNTCRHTSTRVWHAIPVNMWLRHSKPRYGNLQLINPCATKL